MDLHNRRGLQAAARERLSAAESAPKIALIYSGIVVLASLLTTTVDYVLGSQISQTGGLHNLGLRSMLSTFQSMLPIVINFLLMCISLGFTGAMLRISRKQFTSPKSMRIGFARFWVLLRATILQGLLYFLAGMASFYLSFQIFFLTPLSNKMMDAMIPLIEQTSALNPAQMSVDPAMMAEITRSMFPVFILMFVFMVVIATPIFYRYRMVNYVLIDKPGMGALLAMRESRLMMKKHCFELFKLDLSMWWYYLAMVLAAVVCYGDVILALVGVNLPISGTVSYFLFLGLYLLLSMGILFFLRPHVEVTYALAYDSLRPKEPEGGVVLGNIFNM